MICTVVEARSLNNNAKILKNNISPHEIACLYHLTEGDLQRMKAELIRVGIYYVTTNTVITLRHAVH
jgi:hypothetical protein